MTTIKDKPCMVEGADGTLKPASEAKDKPKCLGLSVCGGGCESCPANTKSSTPANAPEPVEPWIDPADTGDYACILQLQRKHDALCAELKALRESLKQ